MKTNIFMLAIRIIEYIVKDLTDDGKINASVDNSEV